jgi:imidazolonepropionase-like amidohydrolase
MLRRMLHRTSASFVFTLVALFTGSAFAQNAEKPQPPAPEKTIVIHAATLIDGTSSQPRHNVTIVVRGNKIVSVGESNVPSGAEVINLSSGTVLPGMIDTHTHLFLQGEDPAEGGYDIQQRAAMTFNC